MELKNQYFAQRTDMIPKAKKERNVVVVMISYV